MQLNCNLLSCTFLCPICCRVVKLLRKRSVNLLSRPQAEGLHSSPSTQRAVYRHPCTLSPWQPQPNTLARSTVFNFFPPFFDFITGLPMLTLTKINRMGASYSAMPAWVYFESPPGSVHDAVSPSLSLFTAWKLENAQVLWGRGDWSCGWSWLASYET